jgi:competence protein ComEC
VIAPRQGEVLALGALRVRIYGPAPRPPGPPPDDPNHRAVAAVVSYGAFDLFLSGDAEAPDLSSFALPPVEAMKVSHHGSADPGLPDLLRRLRPRVAGIEVGRHNTYGHPEPGTLAALSRAGVATYRTDRDGTVRLTVTRDGHMRVRGSR